MKLPSFKETAFAASLTLALTGCNKTEEVTPQPTVQPSATAPSSSVSASASVAVPAPTPTRKYLFNPLNKRPHVMPSEKMPDSLMLLGDSILYKVDEYGKLCVPQERILSLTEGGRITVNTRIAFFEAMSSNDPLRIHPGSVDRAVVLSGTNDAGWTGVTAPETLKELRKIYAELHRRRVSTLALTVPPFEGYKRYVSRFDEIEAKREAINIGIRHFDNIHPDWDFDVLDLAASEDKGGLADNNNPHALAESAGASDHMHMSKAVLGRLINQKICGHR